MQVYLQLCEFKGAERHGRRVGQQYIYLNFPSFKSLSSSIIWTLKIQQLQQGVADIFEFPCLAFSSFLKQPSILKSAMATPADNMAEIDSVPGTVHLIDLDHTMHARHARESGDIVLDPAPSNDANDPLNWTPRRKLLALICQNL